jgi:hypothetical protein
MATSSSSTCLSSNSLVPPVAPIVSDQEVLDYGISVVSMCVLCKYFGYFGITRVHLPFARQFPSGDLLPVTVPNLTYMIDNFSTFTCDQYIEIASAHAIQVASVDRKDRVCDLLHVHICDQACVPNLILFKHLKVARHNYSHVILPVPFEIDHHAQ